MRLPINKRQAHSSLDADSEGDSRDDERGDLIHSVKSLELMIRREKEGVVDQNKVGGRRQEWISKV